MLLAATTASDWWWWCGVVQPQFQNCYNLVFTHMATKDWAKDRHNLLSMTASFASMYPHLSIDSKEAELHNGVE